MTATNADILVVDDQESIRMLTSRWLENSGYRVLAVSSADEALAVVEAGACGVVVADVHLTGHDGIWLARGIRDMAPETALIFISGDAAAGVTLARAGIGAFDYLPKPFTVPQLLEAVDRGARWHEDRLLAFRQQAPQAADERPLWSYDERDDTWVQRADWLPSPAAVSRIVADMHLCR